MQIENNHRSNFDTWLLFNWGYEPDGTPILNRPPMFVDVNGMFDMEWYEYWIEQRREFYEASIRAKSTNTSVSSPAYTE